MSGTRRAGQDAWIETNQLVPVSRGRGGIAAAVAAGSIDAAWASAYQTRAKSRGVENTASVPNVQVDPVDQAFQQGG